MWSPGLYLSVCPSKCCSLELADEVWECACIVANGDHQYSWRECVVICVCACVHTHTHTCTHTHTHTYTQTHTMHEMLSWHTHQYGTYIQVG